MDVERFLLDGGHQLRGSGIGAVDPIALGSVGPNLGEHGPSGFGGPVVERGQSDDDVGMPVPSDTECPDLACIGLCEGRVGIENQFRHFPVG
jgi:hypothetical protein